MEGFNNYCDDGDSISSRKRVSTNPFDDTSSSSSSSETFHDCFEGISDQRPRPAPLNFSGDGVDTLPTDVSFFDSNVATMQTIHHTVLNTEPLNHVDGDNSYVVLQSIMNTPKDIELTIDLSNPWTKLLLLEELGTSSSWVLLLTPYAAFLFSLALDTYSSLLIRSLGPLSGNTTCATHQNNTNVTTKSGWLFVSPTKLPCSHSFSIAEHHEKSAVSPRQFPHSFLYRTKMASGFYFASAPISNVPPMSVFLRGDMVINDMNTNVAALVAQGRVFTSTVVMQNDNLHSWRPIFISQPKELVLACSTDIVSQDSRWNCSSPRIIDVLFSMPGTGILSGEELQAIVLFSMQDGVHQGSNSAFLTFDDDFRMQEESNVFSETPGAESLLLDFNTTAVTKEDLFDFIESSQYTIEHESSSHAEVNIAVRLATMTITVLFTIFWCRALGMKVMRVNCIQDCCCCIRRTNRLDEETPLKKKGGRLWWESHWIVFPERRYLLVLLICLILVQNPLLVVAYFNPELYKSPNVHTAADAIIGIGINGILMITLCLFHGLRYHTAEVTRRRATQQRQYMKLHRAAKYVVQSGWKTDMGNYEEEAVKRYTMEYYDTFGDVDGVGFSGTLDTRLKHDPCGDNWPDFLLPKLFVLFVGVTSVLVASVYRFPVANATEISRRQLHHDNGVYVTSSFIQLFIAFSWMLLILRQASRTGWMLRKEPFLSTRPAQLAYRILLGILLLGIIALLFPSLADIYFLLSKWADAGDLGATGSGPINSGDVESYSYPSAMDMLLKTVIGVSQRFPYSGTASSIGPGKIFYATVCGIIAAFLFLPSTSSTEIDPSRRLKHPIIRGHHNMGDRITERAARKRDKRLIVTLARYTHSWRVFPLPIEKASSKLLSDISFQLGRSKRSVAFFDKYTPVFCLEVACWLLEASWQAYYSPEEFLLDSFAPGRMALDGIGLKLEKAIFDESTGAQAFVATNLTAQVDGEADSIIVVSIRGTANIQNMSMDLKVRQIPLLDQIIGITDSPMFKISTSGVQKNGSDEWFWDSPFKTETIKSYAPHGFSESTGCFVFDRRSKKQKSPLNVLSIGAKAVIKATPVTRQALPCVHEGFLLTYVHIRKQILESIMEVYHRQLVKASKRGSSFVLPKIYVTGHSLGGSVGQLLAMDLASNCEVLVEPMEQSPDLSAEGELFHLPTSPLRTMDGKFSSFEEPAEQETVRLRPPIAVYTYGQPRVGNHAFARIYKQRVPHTFRVVNEGDAFTSLPHTVLMGGTYKHCGLEVMLDEGCTGNILVGPTVVETMFRFTKVRTSLAAHSLERYRDNLESGLVPDELYEYYRGHGISTSTKTSNQSELPGWLTQVKRK